jgi:hypothetical protein
LSGHLTPRALVTGRPDSAKEVSGVLLDFGFEVVGCEEETLLRERCDALGQDALDCYIQLAPHAGGGHDRLSAARGILEADIGTRVKALDAVGPALRLQATVVLVAGESPPEAGAFDDANARFDLLRLLARALRADHEALGVRAVLVGCGCTPPEIVKAASRCPAPLGSHLLDRSMTIDPTMDDMDGWRRDLIARSSPTGIAHAVEVLGAR